MNIGIWIAQGILAAMFLMAGFMKLSQPKEKLKESIRRIVKGLIND